MVSTQKMVQGLIWSSEAHIEMSNHENVMQLG